MSDNEVLQMDGEWPFDDAGGNSAFKRLFNKFLGIFGVPKLLTTSGSATKGVATLSSGTVTVTTDKVKTDSVISLSPRGNTAAGTLDIQTITAGTSFVIRSSSGTDARQIGWAIL